MSKINGDKARAHRIRKKQEAKRKKVRELMGKGRAASKKS